MRKLIPTLIAFSIAAATVVAVAPAGATASTPVSTPQNVNGVVVTVGSGAIRPGDALTISGAWWTPGDTVKFDLVVPGTHIASRGGWTDQTATPLGTATVAADGTINTTITLPTNIPASFLNRDNTLLETTGIDIRTSPALQITTETSLYVRTP